MLKALSFTAPPRLAGGFLHTKNRRTHKTGYACLSLQAPAPQGSKHD